MKDYDRALIRWILLEVEKKPDYHPSSLKMIRGYSAETISEHIRYLKEKEYIIAVSLAGDNKNNWMAQAITQDGRAYLETIR